ncbi:MAG: GNAT family N-acetyltransferase [Spirochaetia bacterium]|nr:GNAT family N-acetyltransferase [Spirochaetia bacterium]
MAYREMTISDYGQVRGLWMRTKGMGLNAVDDSFEGFSRFLLRNPKTCFVAVADTEVAGSILCGHDGRRGHIYHLAVLSEKQRCGIGTQLVNLAIAALQKEDIAKVSFVVFKDNVGGNAFWQHLGFAVREDLVYRNKVIVSNAMGWMKIS